MRIGLGMGLNFRNTSSGDSLMLDTFPAAAAYSLRYLSSSYTGDVILVRRSSDNAELGFTPEEITDGTLLAWVGANNGFVKTWYDQSGNSVNATQNTTTDQPQIVASGVLITSDSTPAIQFDGTNHYLAQSSNPIAGTTGLSVFAVGNADSTATAESIWGVGNIANLGTAYVLTSEIAVRVGGNAVFADDFVNATPLLISNFKAEGASTGSLTVFLNGLSVSLSSHSSTSINIDPAGFGSQIGKSPAGSQRFDGYLSEIILYNSDQSANRTAIETVINSYYSIY